MICDAPLNAEIRQAARQIATGVDSPERMLALTSLYELTADRLVRFASSITRRPHDAEDAVSAAMLKVAARPKLLMSADRPWHYLLRMVRNEALVILRTRSKWSALGMFAERLSGRMVDLVERDEESERVWQALSSLPGTQREVVVLKIWEQMTFAQIAEVLEITPSTAASRYRYAIEKLSLKLKDVEVESDSSAERSLAGGRH